MRLPLIAAALTLAAAANAQDLAAGAAATRDRALTDPTAWNVVESLTTDVGPRPVGSPSMDRARDWGVATLTRLGLQNVAVWAAFLHMVANSDIDFRALRPK